MTDEGPQPDVIINKLRADPWNDVEQGEPDRLQPPTSLANLGCVGTNTKLYTRRPDWWAARAAADMPHPQAAFREEKESSITRALAAKRKLRKMDEAAKAKAATDSVM